MLNMIKADIYIILRRPGVYVTFAVLLGFAALSAWLTLSVTLGGFMGMTIVDGQIVEQAPGQRTYMVNSAAEMLPHLGGILRQFHFFVLAVAIITAAPMFTSGAVKNGISAGLCRTKIFVSKLILSSAIIFIMAIVSMLLLLVAAAVARGFGNVQSGVWGDFIANASAQFFVILAFNFLAVFFVFVTKRTGAVIGVFAAIYLVPMILIQMLSIRFNDIVVLLDFELVSISQRFANLSALTTIQLARGFSVVSFVIIAAAIGGILIFRKAEIK